jgi:tetratricopeptide (TPR) repeat protein/TolB-like protein
MTGNPNKFSKFWQELKRRNTDRVIVAYAAIAFVILQLSDLLEDSMLLPDGTTAFITIILGIGFPIVGVFSWFFDITPGGIQKTKPVPGKKKLAVETELKRWRSTTLISFIVIIALLSYNILSSSFGVKFMKSGKAMAVAPFNSVDDEKEMIENSIMFSQEISAALSNIENITLKEWPPNLNSKFKEISYPEIAKELEVAFMLKGTLDKNSVSNKITLIVQLIRLKSSSLLWGENYSVDLGLKDMNAIKSDITDNILRNLNANVSPGERRRMNKKPSNNPEAVRNYYQGNTVSQRIIFNTSTGNKFFDTLIDSKFFENAIISFDLAIANDSAFALAYAKRAIIRSWAYHTGHVDKSSVELCRMDINKALELDKELIETYIARGFYYYYCLKEFDKALENFSYANSQQPNNWQCIFYMALVQRAMGEWKKSQNLLAKVMEFNPQDPLVLTNIGLSESALRRFEKAIEYQNKAIVIMPEWTAPYVNKIDAFLSKDGNTYEARKVLDTASIKTGNSMREIRILLDIFDGQYEDALHEMQLSEPSDFSDRGNQLITYATLYRYLDKNDDAESFYREAILFYEQALAADPENYSYLSSMGIAYAGLGMKTEAIEAGEKATYQDKSTSMERMERIADLAEIYAMTDEYDKCLNNLEILLKNPSPVSVEYLQIDPVWKPLKEMLEFKKMIGKYTKKV